MVRVEMFRNSTLRSFFCVFQNRHLIHCPENVNFKGEKNVNLGRASADKFIQCFLIRSGKHQNINQGTQIMEKKD